MPRDKNCRETIFVSQLSRNYPHRGVNFEREENALSCGRETVWEAFEETIWARVIASQKLSRDSGETIFAARHQDVSQGPLGSARAVRSRTQYARSDVSQEEVTSLQQKFERGQTVKN